MGTIAAIKMYKGSRRYIITNNSFRHPDGFCNIAFLPGFTAASLYTGKKSAG